jgi:hypothetical protein
MPKTEEQKAADKAARDAKKAADKAAAEAAPAADPTAPAPAVPQNEVVAIVVKFRDHEGKPTERIFSKDVHGDDFAKLADEFKETNAHKLITE